jgi:hypothetical protein
MWFRLGIEERKKRKQALNDQDLLDRLKRADLELYNVGCFGAFGRVDYVELHLLAFGQRLKAAVLNVAEMNEHIAALFAGNESKTFGIIEPLYRACFHVSYLLLGN